MSKNYKKYSQANGDPIQVDSAIRDGNGKNIANNYAKQNGYYSGFTAGLAVNIKTDQGATVTDAVAKFDSISVAVEDGDFASMTNFKGRSFAYNQLVQNGNFENTTKWTATRSTFSVSNNVATVTSTVNNNSFRISCGYTNNAKANDKMLLLCDIKSATLTSACFNGNNMSGGAINFAITSSWARYYRFFSVSTYSNDYDIWLSSDSTNVSNIVVGSTIDFRKCMLFNLTRIFGAGNEPTTIDDATSALRSYGIDISVYNEYSPGKIIDSQPNKIRSIGPNLFDIDTVYSDTSKYTITGNTVSSPTPVNFFNTKRYFTKDEIGKTFTMKVLFTSRCVGTGLKIRAMINNESVISGNLASFPNYATVQLTPTSTEDYIRFDYSTCTFMEISEVMLNYGTTAMTYHPYIVNEYTITAPVMRSAGSVADDKDNVNVGSKTYSSSDVTEFSTTYTNVVYYSIPQPTDYKFYGEWGTSFNAFVSRYEVSVPGTSMDSTTNIGKIVWNSARLTWQIGFAIGTTLAQAQAAIDGLMINYELKTPTPQTGIVLPTNIVTYNGGTLETQYTSPNTTPGLVSMLYQVNLKNFIEGIGAREDINFQPNEITSHDELEQGLEQTYGDVKDDLEKGNLTPALSDNITPYSDESGNLQTVPFVMQGTGCGNGENVIDTGSFAQLKEKRGNSVVVNQWVNKAIFVSTQEVNGVTFTNNGDCSWTVNGTLTDTKANLSIIPSGSAIPLINGNKYLIAMFGYKGTQDFAFYSNTYGYDYGARNVVANIFTSTTNVGSWWNLRFNGEIGDTINERVYPVIINLTQWFSSNDRIPSYLLSHPEDFGRYYSGSLAYNAGTIVNSNARYLKTIGRNQWDEQWEVGRYDLTTGEKTNVNGLRSKNYIPVIPNTSYAFRHPSGTAFRVLFYDSGNNFISAPDVINTNTSYNTFTTPSNACYMNFYSTQITSYSNDITISIYYEDESGYNQYYPYEELDNVDTGTEVLRSAGSVYDVKKPSGKITRYVGSYTFTGNEEWAWSGSSGNREIITTNSTDFGVVGTTNGICNDTIGLQFVTGNYSNDGIYIATPTLNKLQIFVRKYGVITDTATAKQYLVGKTIYYELATPTTEQGTSFQENIKIDDFGSMKWDNESFNGVPQGNAIFYPVDYKAFLDSLNNYTNGDVNNLVLGTDNIPLSKIVDSHGNARFVESNGTQATTTGFTASYCKWSLSGTHLMIVLAGKLDASTTFTGGSVNAVYPLPQWIYDKIYPVYSSYLEVKQVNMRDNNLDSYNTNYALIKSTGTSMKIQNTSSIATSTNDVYFRVQFDLLIDTD